VAAESLDESSLASLGSVKAAGASKLLAAGY
jgi:hypothetical protein